MKLMKIVSKARKLLPLNPDEIAHWEDVIQTGKLPRRPKPYSRYDYIVFAHPINAADIRVTIGLLRSAFSLLEPGGTLLVNFVDLVGLMNGRKVPLFGYFDAVSINNKKQPWLESNVSASCSLMGIETMEAILMHVGFESIITKGVRLATPGGKHVWDVLSDTHMSAIEARKPKYERGSSATEASIISKHTPDTIDLLDCYGYDWYLSWNGPEFIPPSELKIDTKITEQTRRYAGRDFLTDFEQSLRQNWVMSLHRAKPETRLFLEADAAPNVPAKDLEKWCENVVAKHPGTDVIKLFWTLEYVPTQMERTDYVTDLPFGIGREKGSYVWGSHAYWVVNREKLLEVIRTSVLPVDTAVEVAAKERCLNVVVATKNFFWQMPHCDAHQVDKA